LSIENSSTIGNHFTLYWGGARGKGLPSSGKCRAANSSIEAMKYRKAGNP